MKNITITITRDFIKHRNAKMKIYNRRNRSKKQFAMDCDAEVYEHHMLVNGIWKPGSTWMIDGIDQDGRAIDVKFIGPWYNMSCTKMHNYLQQQGVVDGYQFMEWIDRPDRPLKTGDVVVIRPVKYLTHAQLRPRIYVSHQKWGGFYADIRNTKKTEEQYNN